MRALSSLMVESPRNWSGTSGCLAALGGVDDAGFPVQLGKRPRKQPLVQGDPLVLSVEGNLGRVKQLLRVLPDLTGMCAQRKPQTNQIRLCADTGSATNLSK